MSKRERERASMREREMGEKIESSRKSIFMLFIFVGGFLIVVAYYVNIEIAGHI